MTAATIIEALDSSDRDRCFAIRTEVFCGEQKVSREIEFDGLDAECRHYLAMFGDKPVGTARVRALGDDRVKFERMAVHLEYRGKDIGRALMNRAIADAVATGATSGILHAQSHARGFYEKLDFAQNGDQFMEANIPHVCMLRDF